MQGLQIAQRFTLRFTKNGDGTLAELPLPFNYLVGCSSKRYANWANVLSRAIAAMATLALNSAECLRLVLFVILCVLIKSV
jgi:hypothetical protein